MNQYTNHKPKPLRINWIQVHARRAAAIELDRILGVPSRPDVRSVYGLREAA